MLGGGSMLSLFKLVRRSLTRSRLSLLLVSATLHYTPLLYPCQGPLSKNFTDFVNFRTKNQRTNHNERAAQDCSPEALKAWKASLQEALQARAEARAEAGK